MSTIKVIRKFDIDNHHSGIYSFVNPASLSHAINDKNEDIKFFVDGLLLAKLISLVKNVKINRVSFDFTSIAHDLFTYASKEEKNIFIFGAKEKELELFKGKILKIYPDLKIVGSSHGYIKKTDWKYVVDDINERKSDIVLAGLGAGLQEEFLLNLKLSEFNGAAFSCGGFIRQESTKTSYYYPELIDRTHLRWLYRMFKEPHTIKRYLLDYPINLSRFITKIALRQIIIKVN